MIALHNAVRQMPQTFKSVRSLLRLYIRFSKGAGLKGTVYKSDL